MADFDDRSGAVLATADWGKWWQTMEEVFIEIDCPLGTSAKDIKCDIAAKRLKVVLKSQTVLEGTFPNIIDTSESLWTLEDKKLLRLCLIKCDKSAGNCWRCLLDGQYEVDPFTYDRMQQKLTLQRFQFENPGMDFSGANISGNYQGGGPELPQH